MTKHIVSKIVIEEYEAVVEADTQNEAYDIINEGDVEWEFVQGNEEWNFVL